MTLLVTSLLLAALGVALFPCWRYSAHWGCGPSATVGVLLVFVGLLAVTGRDISVDRLGDRLNQPQRMVQRADIGIVPPPLDAARAAERPLAAGGVLPD